MILGNHSVHSMHLNKILYSSKNRMWHSHSEEWMALHFFGGSDVLCLEPLACLTYDVVTQSAFFGTLGYKVIHTS